jgi:hypothetical protein
MSPIDPGTGLTILGGAIGGTKLIEKILGPTAEYIGGGLQNWTQKRVENVGRIFQKAHQKLGERIDQPGTVPPRVLKEILDDGSYCDDELVAEYYGGVLASSRTEDGRDDRGSTYLRLTTQLSTYQIRFHYICYHWWRNLFQGTGLNSLQIDDLDKMSIFIPEPLFNKTMEFSDFERKTLPSISLHMFNGLNRKDLIDVLGSGEPEQINKWCTKMNLKEISERGIVLKPLHFGIEYWLWATSNGNQHAGRFLSSTCKLEAKPLLSLSAYPMPMNKDYPFKRRG